MISIRKTIPITYLVGAIYGILYATTGLAGSNVSAHLSSVRFVEGIALAVFMPFALHLYRRVTDDYLFTPLSKAGFQSDFIRHEPYSYSIFLLSVLFPIGLQPSIAFTFALWVALILIQATLFVLLLKREKRAVLIASEKYIAVLFLVSGFSALIYQVVWQRVLFTTFGINSESVTVIVSVFMFGLGIGSLAGGYLQKKYLHSLLRLFLVLEIAIGLFGLVSLDLIHSIGDMSGTTSTTTLVLWVYIILAVPTLLMGATLPILVAFLQGYFQNIGKTVGLLYAFNTIGSAIAAFCTVKILFVFVGQHTTLLIAAACNFITAYLIFDASRKLKSITTPFLLTPDESDENGRTKSSSSHLPYAFIFATLLTIGYISLSQEILWFRLLGYMTASRPQVFGMLLTAFLIGIAWGSLKSKNICASVKEPYDYLIRALFYATAIFYLAIPVIALASSFLGKEIALLIAYVAIATVAALTGGILPALIHIGVENKRTSSTESMAWLYFANIIGATLGPLLTGFILLDRFPLQVNIVILTVATLFLILAFLFVIPKSVSYKLTALGLMAAMGLSGWFAHTFLYQGHLEKIHYASSDSKTFKHKLENKSGILTVEEANPDVMYGHGIYDGRFNLDPLNNSNLIDRAYMISTMHRRPRRILEIGLSTGSWSKVLSDYQPLQELVIIEINKGYLDIARQYPDIAGVFDNRKVKVVFDDGRRWLRNQPEEKFDFIVMNTTYHWRSNVTNLLSKEFLELCKRHLTDGGVMYYNTTGSKDVVFTAAHVFKHVAMYSTFVAASDHPFNMTTEEKRSNLLQFVDGNSKPIFEQTDNHRHLLSDLAQFKFKDIRQDILKAKDLRLITDDNMAVEYKMH